MRNAFIYSKVIDGKLPRKKKKAHKKKRAKEFDEMINRYVLAIHAGVLAHASNLLMKKLNISYDDILRNDEII